MTDTYRMGSDGRWELVPETEQLIRDEVKRVLLSAADYMQSYYGTPRDTMSPRTARRCPATPIRGATAPCAERRSAPSRGG